MKEFLSENEILLMGYIAKDIRETAISDVERFEKQRKIDDLVVSFIRIFEPNIDHDFDPLLADKIIAEYSSVLSNKANSIAAELNILNSRLAVVQDVAKILNALDNK